MSKKNCGEYHVVRNAEVTMWFALKYFKVVRKNANPMVSSAFFFCGPHGIPRTFFRGPHGIPREKKCGGYHVVRMRGVSCGPQNAEHMMSGACEGGGIRIFPKKN